MKKPIFLVLFFLVAVAFQAQAQKISKTDMAALQRKEDTLIRLAKNIFLDSMSAGRMRSDSQFVKTLVRGLQIRNSFYYPFDSVKGISALYAPDSAFRIFTWQIDFDGYYIRQRGAIQFPTADGALKLVPLRDYSEFTDLATDSVRNKDNWIGAVYYSMIVKNHNGKKYYTLFGFDGNSPQSNKKWIEVLSFDQRNMPVFGNAVFSFEKDSVKRKDQRRYFIEYKKEASTTVNYDEELDMILIDHLISESDEPENAWTLVPDGDYEGFKWVNGKWLHVDKVFDFKLEDGQFPMPKPYHDTDPKTDKSKKKKD
ncbi:MAG TPA: hypothetical protein VFZ78_11150 [Flavisolibacter sp.]